MFHLHWPRARRPAILLRVIFFLMSQFFDLFGEPIVEKADAPGRPEHQPTDYFRFKIMILQSIGKTQKEIAGVVGISVPTLRKHYFSILMNQKKAQDREFAMRATALYRQGLDGNASAFKEYDRLVERALLKAQSDAVKEAAKRSSEYKPKNAREIERAASAANESGWGDLVNSQNGRTIQ